MDGAIPRLSEQLDGRTASELLDVRLPSVHSSDDQATVRPIVDPHDTHNDSQMTISRLNFVMRRE
jgi:hypothetical protein